MLRHEIQATRATAHDRLPHGYGPMDGPGDERELFELIASIGDIGWDRIMLSMVGERFFIESLEDDLHLLFEQFAVGISIQHGRAEGLHFTGVIPPSHPKADPA